MGSAIRILVGVPVAAVVTVIIFLIMYSLISSDEISLGEVADPVQINIGRKIEDTNLQANQAQFERPQLDQPPPPPPAINDANFKPNVDGVRAAAPQFDTNVDIGTGFNPDRDAQPLVRIPPQYPDRCQGRSGTRETVRVQFDVNPQGQTLNIQVIDTTSSCFNRAAIRAVERWKYQPKVVDGEAQSRFGVQTTFQFDLAE